jgi:hypothetical protein
MSEPIAPYHERLADLERELSDRGSLGLLVLDASPLGRIEDEYGTRAYEEVRQRFFKIIDEARGKDYRQGDVVCLDRPRGLRFLFLLDRKRRRSVALSIADLRTARGRVVSSLAPNIARAAFPYIKTPPRLDVGHGLAVHNPLLHSERVIERALEDALAQASHERRAEELGVLERLQDILLRERVVTGLPADPAPAGEHDHGLRGALARAARLGARVGRGAVRGRRGPRTSRSSSTGLCRKRALLSSNRIPSNAKIFVNTLPATMRDPQFRDKAADRVPRTRRRSRRADRDRDHRAGGDREPRDVLGDDGLLQGIGMSFAVDDVGAATRGSTRSPSSSRNYLKIDIGLVRDVHTSSVNRAMVKAIIALGHSIDANVIAEGINNEEEAQVLLAMGVDLGQGFHLARPDAGLEPS